MRRVLGLRGRVTGSATASKRACATRASWRLELGTKAGVGDEDRRQGSILELDSILFYFLMRVSPATATCHVVPHLATTRMTA
eukprot:scaffold87716_cov30-Tisochrysis_lutea.AAC.1